MLETCGKGVVRACQPHGSISEVRPLGALVQSGHGRVHLVLPPAARSLCFFLGCTLFEIQSTIASLIFPHSVAQLLALCL